MGKENIEKKYKLVDLGDRDLIKEGDTLEKLEIVKVSAEGRTIIEDGEKVKVISRVILETTDKEKKRISFKPLSYKRVVSDIGDFEFSEREKINEVSIGELPIQFKEISKRLKEGKTVNVKVPITTYKKVTDKGEMRYYTINRNKFKDFVLI